MRAYKQTYLHDAAGKFGSMMDYTVNDCGIDGDCYLHMFITSGLAEQFECGNPKVVVGMSGIDLATEAIHHATGKTSGVVSPELGYRTAEYWGGWALAYYQWYTAKSFSGILRFMPFGVILDLYPTLHEADITKFFSVADDIYTGASPQTNLKRMRENAGLSQSGLAAEAEVSLRSIQMYEQRNKDINKAQAITVLKLSRILGCRAEDLVEHTVIEAVFTAALE